MNFDYDVVIIGGAFSGAATALILKRKCPEARVLVIEKASAFDRKVGESTTEVSSCYMTRKKGRMLRNTRLVETAVSFIPVFITNPEV